MADYETSQRRRNTAVGLFVLLGIGAFVWMMYLFGELPLIAARWRAYEIHVRFDEAPGIQENTAVYFSGYPVGRVTQVRPPRIMENLETGQWSHMSQVTLAINNRFDRIPCDVRIRLMQRGFGSSFIRLDEQPYPEPERPGPFLTQGTLVQGETGITSEFFPEETQERLQELVDSMTVLLNNANDIIGDEDTKENLRQTMANLGEVTAQASLTLAAFEEFAATGSGTLESADQQVQQLVHSLTELSGEIGLVSSELRTMINRIHEGEGTAARLLNDPRLYEQLLEDARQLDMLMQEIRAFIQEAAETGLPFRLR